MHFGRQRAESRQRDRDVDAQREPGARPTAARRRRIVRLAAGRTPCVRRASQRHAGDDDVERDGDVVAIVDVVDAQQVEAGEQQPEPPRRRCCRVEESEPRHARVASLRPIARSPAASRPSQRRRQQADAATRPRSMKPATPSPAQAVYTPPTSGMQHEQDHRPHAPIAELEARHRPAAGARRGRV